MNWILRLLCCATCSQRDVGVGNTQILNVCVGVQSLALAHANVDNDFVFLDKW